jgi:hypothetical protein
MHQINPNFVALAQRDGFAAKSPLDLLKEGLEANEPESSEEMQLRMKSFKHQIQVNREAAIFMLQLRENFLPVVVLSKISGIAEPGAKGFFEVVKNYLGRWDSRIPRLNTDKLIEYTEYLKASNDLRDFLYHLGVRHFMRFNEYQDYMRLDRRVQKIYRNLKLDNVMPAPLLAGASQRERA